MSPNSSRPPFSFRPRLVQSADPPGPSAGAVGAFDQADSLTVPSPKRLVPLGVTDETDASFACRSRISYRIDDQFNAVLPRRVEINEKFATDPVADVAGTTWRRGPQGHAAVNPASWVDRVQGEVATHTSTPQPQNPLGNTKVQHWSGEWYVGSRTTGSGVKVQTNTWQKYRDHARRENIVSHVQRRAVERSPTCTRRA